MSKIRVLCPFHIEQTPSCVIYGDRYKCFGCGKHGPISELPESKRPKHVERSSFGPRFSLASKNRMLARLKEVHKLPCKLIRGFVLPYDEESYYLVYPSGKYFIQRFFEASHATKYKAPSNVPKPLWIDNTDKKDLLLLVEGQLNAMVAKKLAPQYAVCSPGGAADLMNKYYLQTFLQYKKVCIIIDKDAAGVMNASLLKRKLLERDVPVAVYAMEKDLNDYYTKEGEEKATKEIQKALALLGV